MSHIKGYSCYEVGQYVKINKLFLVIQLLMKPSLLTDSEECSTMFSTSVM